MKKVVFVALMALLLPDFAFATLNVGSEFKAGDINYMVTSTAPATVQVGGYNGFSVSSGTSTPVVIPSKVKDAEGTEYTVTAIGRSAFSDCYLLPEVTIPSTVTSIGSNAFYGCKSLSSIIIPSSVISIKGNPFHNCTKLSSIVVESGNPVYDSRDNCNAIINSATNELMTGCMSTVIPSTVTTIYSEAFYMCSGLKSITIPKSVTYIGENASYKTRAFMICPSLSSIVVEEGNPVYDSRDNCNAIIKTATNELLTASNSTVIPQTVTAIGFGAFNSKDMNSMTIPEAVARIDSFAFSACARLNTINIPKNVKFIGWYAFSNCKSLKKVKSKIEEPFAIDKMVFNGLPEEAILFVPEGTKEKYEALEGWNVFKTISEGDPDEIHIGDTFKENEITYQVTGLSPLTIQIGDGQHRAIPSTQSGDFEVPSSVTGPDGNIYTVTGIAKYSFSRCNLSSVTIPNSVTTIGGSAFENCTSLTSVTIPNSVTSIGFFAFYGCSSLTSATISNSMTVIEAALFEGCSSLTSITIPNSVTSIEMYAFALCSNLTSFNIPSSVTYIGHEAFAEIGWCNNQPDGILYKDNWLLGYKGEKPEGPLVIPEGTIGIASYALFECSGLTSVTMPNSLKGIGEDAFYGCSGLTAFSIPNSLIRLGAWAFHDTGWYNNQPDGIMYQDNWLVDYKGQDPVTVYIAEGTERLSEGAFCGSEQLVSVTLPSSIVMIGRDAFADCLNLQEVKSYIKEPFALSKNNFKNWSDATQSMDVFTSATLYVPYGTKAKYEATEGWRNFKDIVEMEPTNIGCVKNDTQSEVFTLTGLKVGNNATSLKDLKKGIYIIEGQKVIVK